MQLAIVKNDKLKFHHPKQNFYQIRFLSVVSEMLLIQC